jgi:hypothetical protein
MSKLPERRDESLGGYIVHGVPFPVDTSPEALAFLKKMSPIEIEQEYRITYLHSYGQDSPWFAGLANRKLLGSRDPESGYTYALPRGHDMASGSETEWSTSPTGAHALRSVTLAWKSSCQRPLCWR